MLHGMAAKGIIHLCKISANARGVEPESEDPAISNHQYNMVCVKWFFVNQDLEFKQLIFPKGESDSCSLFPYPSQGQNPWNTFTNQLRNMGFNWRKKKLFYWDARFADKIGRAHV